MPCYLQKHIKMTSVSCMPTFHIAPLKRRYIKFLILLSYSLFQYRKYSSSVTSQSAVKTKKLSDMTYLQDMLQICRWMATETHMLLTPMTDDCPLMSHPHTLLIVGRVDFAPKSLYANVINMWTAELYKLHNLILFSVLPIHNIMTRTNVWHIFSNF